MTYRTDKFKVGDIVVWAKRYDHILSEEWGKGPFKVAQIIDREYESYDEEQSNWSAMGHTQHLIIEGHEKDFEEEPNYISGAFFVAIAERNDQ